MHIKDDFIAGAPISQVPATWFNRVARFCNSLVGGNGISLDKHDDGSASIIESDGGGGNYSAGSGIDISDSTISVKVKANGGVTAGQDGVSLTVPSVENKRKYMTLPKNSQTPTWSEVSVDHETDSPETDVTSGPQNKTQPSAVTWTRDSTTSGGKFTHVKMLVVSRIYHPTSQYSTYDYLFLRTATFDSNGMLASLSEESEPLLLMNDN